MEAPSLEVTGSAIDALQHHMALISDFEPVVVLSWVLGASWGEILPNGEENIQVRGPHWGVGFHSRAKLPPEEVVDLAGMPFTFGATAQKFEWLNGATLDFVDGQFEVTKRAI